MKKYRFSTVQRFAIWRVYGKKCFYCEHPPTFTAVTIDHIIPEHVLDNVEQLQAIKVHYGLNTDFSINDYCNWVPAHPHCNQGKGITVYPPKPAFIMILEKVQRKGLPATALQTDYPRLCDWLEEDLIKQLGTLLTCSFYYPEASQRTGETLSVRLAFLQLNFNVLDELTSSWWEILEIQYYSTLRNKATPLVV